MCFGYVSGTHPFLVLSGFIGCSSCKEFSYDSYPNVAGGGSRVLALLIAFTITIAMFSMPATNTANAADGDKLYCIANNGTKLVPYTGPGTVTGINGGTNSSYKGGIFATINGQTRMMDATTCKPMDDANYTQFADFTNGLNADLGAHSSIGGNRDSSPEIGVDNDGRLWFYENDQDRWVHTADTYRFSAIAAIDPRDSNTINSSGTLLFGHRVSDTQGATVINQMPTTGAPTGLSTAGLIAVGIGLMAVGVGLVKRRRV